jgi:hypothetical protein
MTYPNISQRRNIETSNVFGGQIGSLWDMINSHFGNLVRAIDWVRSMIVEVDSNARGNGYAPISEPLKHAYDERLAVISIDCHNRGLQSSIDRLNRFGSWSPRLTCSFPVPY